MDQTNQNKNQNSKLQNEEQSQNIDNIVVSNHTQPQET